MTKTNWIVTMAVLTAVAPAQAAEPVAELPPLQILQTPGGVRFGIYGKKGTAPAPVLFAFAIGLEDMQRNPRYADTGRLLLRHGFLTVTLDPPCHGADSKPGEPPQLRGWRTRVEKGEPLVAPFTARATAVLDYLIKEGYADAERVAVCGTSRGGFLAFHFAAADPRVKAVAAFSPVTNLAALSEFKGLEKKEEVQALALTTVADKLAGRPAWLSIGNNDARVSTDDAIAFSRRLVAAGVAANKEQKVVPVELIVGPSPGHGAIERADELAAAWFVNHFGIK